MIGLTIYGIVIAHILAYKHHYINIGTTFIATFITKRLIKSFGNNNHADLIGLSGYVLTWGGCMELIKAMKANGIGGVVNEENTKIVGGLVGKIVEEIQKVAK